MKVEKLLKCLKNYIEFNPNSCDYKSVIGYGKIENVIFDNSNKIIFVVTSNKTGTNTYLEFNKLLANFTNNGKNVLDYDIAYTDMNNNNVRKFKTIEVKQYKLCIG